MREVRSELAASVWKVLSAVDNTVVAGQEIAILESMKMEIPVEAPVGGTVRTIDVQVGDAVDAGTLIATIDPS